jgi:glycosyltransferase involved in cell wall biosynthesis
LKIGEILAGANKEGWKRNLTITNSDWSGKIMKENYGIETKTIYPPVASEFPDIPWNKKEEGFIVLARLSPEKRIERVIKILKNVRKKGQNIHLHILGKLDDSDYVKGLKLLCEKNKEWISLEGLVVGHKKLEFIAQHKFSISGRENEPFGIAVAEAVKAGCITWVPNGGGQVEIVNHSALVYDDVDDAVNKIDKVIKNDIMQVQLREHLAKQAEKFSTKRFMSEIREVVHQFLKEKKNLKYC